MERYPIGCAAPGTPYGKDAANDKTKGRFSNENLPFLHTEGKMKSFSIFNYFPYCSASC